MYYKIHNSENCKINLESKSLTKASSTYTPFKVFTKFVCWTLYYIFCRQILQNTIKTPFSNNY